MPSPNEQILEMKIEAASENGAEEAGQRANQEGTATSNDPSPVNIYSTGSPGRPTIKHLIRHELDRRVTDKVFETALGKEAEALHLWAKPEHSQAPTPTTGTIENLIRNRHREVKSSDKQTKNEKP